MKKIALALFLSALFLNIFGQTETVTLKIDLNKTTGKMNPFWAWWGADEPNYAYMKDGKKLLSE